MTNPPTEMPATDDRNCADACLASGEPLAGTAIEVDVWIMLEYRKAWQAKATENNTLTPAAQTWLAASVAAFAALGLKARPQFIRRPQRSAGLQLFVARGGKLHGLTVTDEAELVTLDLCNTALPQLNDAHYFVCTNAKRDVCCARLGRPTFAALHQLRPDHAWQTTHVGGHRYAPNVLALPQAALYGQVMPADVPGFIDAIEHNTLDRRYLRGRTGYPPVAQAAEQVLEQAGELIAVDDSSATFATPAGPRTIAVLQEPSNVLASCGKPAKPVKILRAEPPAD